MGDFRNISSHRRLILYQTSAERDGPSSFRPEGRSIHTRLGQPGV